MYNVHELLPKDSAFPDKIRTRVQSDLPCNPSALTFRTFLEGCVAFVWPQLAILKTVLKSLGTKLPTEPEKSRIGPYLAELQPKTSKSTKNNFGKNGEFQEFKKV